MSYVILFAIVVVGSAVDTTLAAEIIVWWAERK